MSKKTEESKKRVFLQIELDEEEKQEIKDFCKAHHIKQSVFGRQAIRFFLNRDILPVGFKIEKEELAGLDIDIFEITKPLMKEIKDVKDKLELLDSSIISVRRDLANSNISVTSEIAQYVAEVSSKIEGLKSKVEREG
jgi:DNA primase catalytic subunit